MTGKFRPSWLAGLFVFLLACLSLHAQITFTELASFDGTNGNSPSGPLVLGRDGNFYGTSPGDQINNYPGAIFKMTPDGTLSNLITFPTTYPWNGDFVPSTPLIGSDGDFYFTTQYSLSNNNNSGYGKILRLTQDNNLSEVFSFSGTNGSVANGLIQSADGNLYGITQGGGNEFQPNGASGDGTVYGTPIGGTPTTLIYFNGTNGQTPVPPLVQTPDGNLYGMTLLGGTNGGHGTLFRVSNGGDFQSLVSFNGTDGARPEAGLTLGIDGNLYGTTQFGGSNSTGNIFRFPTNSTPRTLVEFNSTNGIWPDTRLLQASDGNFYGGTQYGGTNGGPGTIFCATPEGNLKTVYFFSGRTHGFGPITDLIQGSDGSFFGTYMFGGKYGLGSVFRLTVPGAELPKIQMKLRPGNMIELSWIPLPLRTYAVQSNSDPSSTNWVKVGDPISPTNSPVTATVGSFTNASSFYRVALLPQ